MSIKNIENVVLYIDSQYRSSGTNEDFTIILDTPISKILQVEILGAEIPFTFYTINASNNILCWTNILNTTYKVAIPFGSYSVFDFTTTLQNLMNTQMSGFTITFTTTTYKLTFSNTNAFRLDFTNALGTSTIANLIGLLVLSPLTDTSTTVTMTGVINIGGPRYLLIKSSTLTKPKVTRPFVNRVQDNVVYKIAINGTPGSILIEKNICTNLLKYGVRQSIQELDFQLTDDKNNVIFLNGLNWSFTVNLTVG